MIRFVFKEPVLKAGKKKGRPPWKLTRTPKRMQALSNRMTKAVNVNLLHGIKTFRKKIPDKEVIYQAWLKGDYSAIDREIPWNELPEDIKPARNKLFEALTESAGFAVEGLPAPIQENFRYDYKNPRIERVWAKRTGEWIVDPIIQGGRDSIQQIVHRQMTQGLSPIDLAGEIKNYVGLYPRLANAHTNYVMGLKEKGFSPERIDALSEKYYNELLDYRSMMIARTETQFMLNRGQLEVWRQTQDSGLITREAQKVWVVDGAPCEICAPMDGQAVGLAESWVLNNGDVVEIPTEAHPHCFCIMTLDIPDGDSGSSKDEDEAA